MKTYSICAIFLLTFLTFAGCNKEAVSDRQAEVAEVGAVVMPFDLDRSTHIFEKTETGGLQQVLSDDLDEAQILLIQLHLEEEAGRFSKGDFHDPEMIHGHNMPGLHDLAMGHDRINIEYSSLENGAQIVYSSEDRALIEALHLWFDAQLSDHGAHAQGSH